MKKYVKGLIFLGLTLVLIIYILKDTWRDSLNMLYNSNYMWIFLCLVSYFIYFLLEAFCLYKLIREYKKDYSFWECFKLNVMSRFFNAITPFSSGGQPLQVYELKKDGLRVIDGTAIMTESFLIFQMSVVIWAIIAIIYNTITGAVGINGLTEKLATIGFVINFCLLFIVLAIGNSKNFSKKVIHVVINILSKLRIIKNASEKREQLDKSCQEYYISFKVLLKKRKLALYLIFLEIVAMLFYFSVAYLAFKALNIPMNMTLVTSIIAMVYVFFVGTFVPIPGGSGGIEYAFITLFMLYFDKSYVLSALIIWRFVYYYLPMIIGGIFFSIKRLKEK